MLTSLRTCKYILYELLIQPFLYRSEGKVSKLSNELKDCHDAKKEVVEESLQRLQIQNENQKLVLVQATKRLVTFLGLCLIDLLTFILL